MKKLKIKDLKNELYFEDIGAEFLNYNEGYIGDIITEIADNNVSMYTCDVLEWAKGNYSYVEEAIDELGVATDSNGRTDLIRTIQTGEYIANKETIDNNLEEILKFYMYNYIEKDLGIEEITEEQNNELLHWDFENYDEHLENLIDYVNEIMEVQE